MGVSKLWDKVNYTAPLNHHYGYITEYDLSKANISALFSRGIISKELYNELFAAEKHYREVYIGNMIKKDKEVYKEIAAGIKDAKKLLFETNAIEDREVIGIHNDAVFFAGSRNLITDFDYYHFAKKNTYIHYIYLSNKMKFFYRYDKETDSDVVDIKGISQEKLSAYEQPFVQFIINMQYMLTNIAIDDTVATYNEYNEKYINRKLPIANYRELNSENGFRFNTGLFSFYSQNVSEKDINDIDIGYNNNLLRDIGRIVYEKYFIDKNVR